MAKTAVVILGPTSSGKTRIAVEISKKINSQILCADSRQVYRELNIASGKEGLLKKIALPTLGERQVRELNGINQFGVDLVSLRERFTVYDYKKEAEQILSLFQPFLIITGGTPLYVDALAYDFTLPREDITLREKLTKLSDSELKRELKEKDPQINPAVFLTRQRMIRALEIVLLTGKPLSLARKRREKSRFPLFGIMPERSELYKQIDKRVEEALKQGLVEEIANLREQGYADGLLLSCGLWVKITVEYLRGELKGEEFVFRLKAKTHEFARRQLSWWRQNQEICWYNDSESLIKAVLNYYQS